MALTVPQVALGPATLAITQGIGLFSTFLPHVTEVVDSVGDKAFQAKVRVGEVGAAFITLSMGAVMSALVGNWSPFIVSIMIATGMVAFYEWALNQDFGDVGNG